MTDIRPVSPDEAARIVKHKDYIDPITELERLTTSAKWFFATVGVVGTLATGLGVAGIAKLSGSGQMALALVLILVGASLAVAALTLAPTAGKWAPYQDGRTIEQLGKAVRFRTRGLQAASVLFALAFVGAGAVQACTLISEKKIQRSVAKGLRSRPEKATYSLSAEGALTAVYSSAATAPNSIVEIALEACPQSKAGMAQSKASSNPTKPKTSTQTVVNHSGPSSNGSSTMPRTRVASAPAFAAGDTKKQIDTIGATLKIPDSRVFHGQVIIMTRERLAAANGLPSAAQPNSMCNDAVRVAGKAVLLRIPIL